MQLNKAMRTTGISLSIAALALLAAEGPAAAHDGTTSPDLRGHVTSVATGDFVMQKLDGTSETVDTTSGTTFAQPGSSMALSAVQDGENVAVTLDPSALSPTATNVVVFPERESGRVSSVNGSTVTLTNRRGTDTVLVSPSTKYYERGMSPTDVTVGELASAFGLPDATPGELDAQVVSIFSPGSQPPPQPAPITTPPTTTPPTTTAVTPPTAPQTPAVPNPTGWNRSASNGASFPHGPSGGPGSRGGNPGGFGGHGGHR